MSPPPSLRLLDAEIVIDLQRKHPAAAAWFASLNLAAVAVPGFVAMEMIQSARDKREAHGGRCPSAASGARLAVRRRV